VTTLYFFNALCGWDLAFIVVPIKTPLHALLWFLFTLNGSIKTTLMRKWNLTGSIANPPNAHGLPTRIPYIRQDALDMAYVPPPGPQETRKKFKNRLYRVLLTMATTSIGTSELRIVRKYPGIAWQQVWTNVHTTGLPTM